MKKMKNLALACLLIFGIAACSDDDSSDNPPASNSETVTKEFTAKIGETKTNTITLTNPLSKKAKLDIYVMGSVDSSIIIDPASSCGDLTRGYLEDHSLDKDGSCDIKYTYKPTEMNTALLTLNIDYNIDVKELCPTEDTKPSFNDVVNGYKNIEMNIYNYAEDKAGNKSPEWVNLDFDIDYMVYNDSDIAPRSSEKEFTLLMRSGEYTFNNYDVDVDVDLDIKNKENCVRDGNKLTISGDKGCTFTAKAYSDTEINFQPTQTGSPYYNVEINVNSKQEYDILGEYGNTFRLSYYASEQEEESYFDVAVLKKGEEITSYEITGTNKDKFKVVGTKYDACSVTSNKISIPNGKEFCFYTVDIDKKEAGEFSATLEVTLNDNTNQTYNIEGEVDLMTIDDALKNFCKSYFNEKKSNQKSFKLFQ